jgi:hypothetical protein
MGLAQKAFDRLAGRDAVANDVAELIRLRAFLPGHGFSLRRLLRMRKYNRICRRNNCFIPKVTAEQIPFTSACAEHRTFGLEKP